MGKITPIHWTEEEDQFFKDNFLELSSREFAAHFGKSRCAIEGHFRKLGLKLPKEIYELRQKSQWWGKEHVGFRPPKGIHLSPETEFKKGHLPVNMKCDGHISTRTHVNKKTYKYIRVAQGKWELLNRVIWEKKHGKIPEGMIVAFKNGDTMDCELGNLKLITKAQNLKRNKPKDLHSNMDYRYGSDKWVVSYLTRDPELRKDIIKNHPELIEIKRKQLQLRREINAA